MNTFSVCEDSISHCCNNTNINDGYNMSSYNITEFKNIFKQGYCYNHQITIRDYKNNHMKNFTDTYKENKKKNNYIL